MLLTTRDNSFLPNLYRTIIVSNIPTTLNYLSQKRCQRREPKTTTAEKRSHDDENTKSTRESKEKKN